MSYREIPYSKLTKGPATITVPFMDNRGDPRYPIYTMLSSGCVVPCSEVYSLCRGLVVACGNLNHRTVTVQYNASICITYANLKAIEVSINQAVDAGTKLGVADIYVRVELLQPTGPSSVWPVNIGAYQYYKQDPEKYISGESVLSDGTAASYTSSVYPETFNYQLLSPYVITLQSDSPQYVDWTALKSQRISGAVLYAGSLFDASHRRRAQFMNSKIPQWVAQIQSVGVLHGYYFMGRATNRDEAKAEIYELSYIIRNWPATLGVWVRPEFSRTVATNDLILDTYRDALVELGLTGAIGIYTDAAGMNTFTWAAKQSDWLLWLVRRCTSVAQFDTALTPDFFRL